MRVTLSAFGLKLGTFLANATILTVLFQQINVDFELGFPNKGSLLFSRWTEVSEVLLGELKSAKCDVPDSFDNGEWREAGY